MKKNLSIYYDKEADLLEIRIGEPTECYFDDVGDDVFERRDEKTNELKGFAIFNFKKRTGSLKDINLKLPVGIEFVK